MERYDWQQRTELLLGEEKMERIRSAHVLVVGLGGVGAYAAEMICRAGVGRMTIVDADTVQPTNMNRQLPAMHSTLGRTKAEVLAARYKDINPEIELAVLPVYLKDENIPELLDADKYDFIVDAIDTISPKCFLIYEAMKRHIKIVSSMGAGAKSDITQVRFADLWETYHCGLSKAVRKRLQKMGMKRKLPVVFSTEQADPKAVLLTEDEQNKKSTCGTVSYMPAVFGCHGNDPTYTGTDHTREKVPFLAYSKKHKGSGPLPEEDSFAVIGATIADNFSLAMPEHTIGHSILDSLR